MNTLWFTAVGLTTQEEVSLMVLANSSHKSTNDYRYKPDITKSIQFTTYLFLDIPYLFYILVNPVQQYSIRYLRKG